jgi:hypothetical protein
MEVRNAKMLSGMGLGAEFFTAWMERDSKVPVEYGFIAVEKGDCTIKDLILKNKWKQQDVQMVKTLAQKLHGANVIHRDFKPANILCFLNGENVQRVAFIDCAKVRTVDDLGPKEFKKKLAKEYPHFQKHIVRNIKERRRLAKEGNKDLNR